MPQIYCPSCGRANEHSGVKPIFCGFCGDSLTLEGTASEPSSPQPPRAQRAPLARQSMAVGNRVRGQRRRPQYEEDDDYEDEPTQGIPDIDRLEIEIELPERERTLRQEKVGEVWGSGGGFGDIRETPKKVNKKKTLASFTDRIFKKTVLDFGGENGNNSDE